MKVNKSKKKLLYEVAKYYSSLGWSVIPVNADKTPLVNWKEFQSRRPTREELQKWFRDGSADGIAIVTGKISNLIVLDFEKGQKVPKFPFTATVLTGGGGKHIYFTPPEGVEISNSARPFGKDYLMDVRSEGGYVVAPPSMHKSGNCYEWENDIANNEIAKLPDIYKTRLQNNPTSKTDFTDIVGGVNEGSRHDSAVRVVGLLLHKFDHNDWKTIAWQLFKGFGLQCKPPMNRDELKQIFVDIANKELAKRKQQQSGNNNLLNYITIDDLMAEEDTEPDWLVDSLVPNGGITILAGKARNFKTWMLLHLALSVATGDKVFGHFNTMKAPVLIVDEENQKRTLRKRLTMLGYKPGSDLHFVIQSGFKITTPQHMNYLSDLVRKHSIRLVIFDSLMRVHNKDESASTGMAEVFATVKQLNRLGAAVLFTHHHRKQDSGNSADNMRGSSDILAAVDAQMSVQRNDQFIFIEQNKNRDMEELKPFTVLIDSTENSMSLKYEGQTPEQLDKEGKAEILIVKSLESGEQSQSELIEKLKGENIGGNKVGSALRQLVFDKKIIEITGEHNKKTYSLPPTE
jgi:hypothetical protein